MGTLVPYSTSVVNITNCTVNNLTVKMGADMSSTTCYLGGLVGHANSSATVNITNSAVTGLTLQAVVTGVIGPLNLGGLVGYFGSNTNIGGTANNYVCGEVIVAKPAYQSEDDLKLTIK